MAKRSSSKRVIYRGNELFRKIALPETGQTLRITYWDLWFIVALLNEFEGDWEQMINHFRQEARGINARYSAEPMLSHLGQLRQMLTEAGLSAEAVLGEAKADLLKRTRRKAQTKILKNAPPRRDMSPWMIYTPRVKRYERAMHSHWNCFTVSPEQYAKPFARLFKSSDWYQEDETFDLERRVSAFVDKQLDRASLDEKIALYRAVMTVALQKIERIDDSYGVIGQFYGEIFEHYTALPRSKLTMALADFFQDLMELLIWEDYGLTYMEQPAFFASLAPAEVSLVETILRTQWQELLELDLFYQAEEALTMLGRLCVQQRLFDRFVELAEAMGTRHWQRITTMAEMAEEHQQPDLALAVYETAMGPGMHERFLSEKYEELKQRIK
jgi:hypothetical protein